MDFKLRVRRGEFSYVDDRLSMDDSVLSGVSAMHVYYTYS